MGPTVPRARFSSAVVKLTAVCNLNCSYCYMFNQSDQTFRRVPGAMGIDTALAFLDRLEAYLDRRPGRFTIVLHGGEPTLWPLDHFRRFLTRAVALKSGGMDVLVRMQTNGLRLTDPLLEVLRSADVHVGVSLDGPAEYNDQYRVTRGGAGSYSRVMAQVERAMQSGYGSIIDGFLSVANPSIPPDIYLDWVESLPVTHVDVLWPIEYHWSNPPWALDDFHAYSRAPRFGMWMAALFEEWVRRDKPEIVVRTFYDLVLRALGSRRHTDSIVNDELGLFVVNTDGAYEYPDYFRAYRDGGSRTPYHLTEVAVDELGSDPGFAFCLSLGTHLPTECRPCPHISVCGGGFLPGRFGDDPVPNRRSVLCFDHYFFFSVVRRHLDTLGLPSWQRGGGKGKDLVLESRATSTPSRAAVH